MRYERQMLNLLWNQTLTIPCATSPKSQVSGALIDSPGGMRVECYRSGLFATILKRLFDLQGSVKDQTLAGFPCLVG